MCIMLVLRLVVVWIGSVAIVYCPLVIPYWAYTTTNLEKVGRLMKYWCTYEIFLVLGIYGGLGGYGEYIFYKVF